MRLATSLPPVATVALVRRRGSWPKRVMLRSEKPFARDTCAATTDRLAFSTISLVSKVSGFALR